MLSTNLWKKQQTHYVCAFLRALQLLQEFPSLPNEEVALNRTLYFCLLKANRELDPEGLYPPPVTECCNQPDPDDSARTARENKRPDFQWGFTDPHEPDYQRSSKQFVVECKRIGVPPRSDWILNENYVEYGLRRFVDPSWGYAKGSPAAAMIGYWQSMDGEALLLEINSAAERRGLEHIALAISGWKIAAITVLGHVVLRSFAISPFRLDHFWVDLRQKHVPRSGELHSKPHDQGRQS